MATCADCIHVKVCQKTRIMNSAYDYAPKCDDFKDCSRFVELPCKVGDVVYRICPIHDCDDCRRCPLVCADCYNIGFVNDYANSIRMGKANDYNWILKRAQYFGKIYFVTKEAAEQALKEREKNA